MTKEKVHGKTRSLFRKGVFSLVFVAAAGLTLCGCLTIADTISDNQAAKEKATAPVIEAINVTPSQEQTVVEIVSSEPVFYTAFKLLDPPESSSTSGACLEPLCLESET